MILDSTLFLIGGVTLVDLMFSFDNVLVVGSVASVVSRNQRWIVLLLGAIGSLLLRLFFIHLIILLFLIPLLKLIGGLLVLLIAIQLIKKQEGNETRFVLQAPVTTITKVQASIRIFSIQYLTHYIGQLREDGLTHGKRKLLLGIAMIILVDTAASLDNIVAIAGFGVSNRVSDQLIAIGLLFSKALLLVGSALIAELMQRLPWLIPIADFILARTAGELISSAGKQEFGISFMRFGQWVFPAPWFIYGFCYLIVLFASCSHFLKTKEMRAGERS